MSLADDIAEGQPTPEDRLLAEIERSKHRLEHKQIKAALAQAMKVIAEKDEQIGLLTALSGKPKPEPFRLSVGGPPKGSATALGNFSDWHLEEPVHPAVVGGRNEFNLTIAKQRVKKTTERFLKLLNQERHITPIRRAVLGYLGDFATGWLHPENVEVNVLSPLQAFEFAHDQLEQQIGTIADEPDLDDILVICTKGNHARITNKTRFGNSAATSYEFFMYRSLRKRFQHNKKLRWLIAEGDHLYAEVEGHVCRYQHGDRIMYQGGVGGLTIPANKAISKWNETERAYVDFFGHHHFWFNGESFVCNGSLIGYNAYALGNKCPFQRPCQTFAVMDKQQGLTTVKKIFCD